MATTTKVEEPIVCPKCGSDDVTDCTDGECDRTAGRLQNHCHKCGHAWDKLGRCGWPSRPSEAFPGEYTLCCPKCNSTNVTMSIRPGFSPTVGYSIWMPGASEYNKCNRCGHQS